jgi:hypothetical protein
MVREAEFNQLLDAAKKTLRTGDTCELKVAVGQVDIVLKKRLSKSVQRRLDTQKAPTSARL